MRLLIVKEPIVTGKSVFYKIRNVVVLASNELEYIGLGIKKIFDSLPDEDLAIAEVLLEKYRENNYPNEDTDVEEISYYQVEEVQISTSHSLSPPRLH